MQNNSEIVAIPVVIEAPDSTSFACAFSILSILTVKMSCKSEMYQFRVELLHTYLTDEIAVIFLT
jgi:hypothetical protein